MLSKRKKIRGQIRFNPLTVISFFIFLFFASCDLDKTEPDDEASPYRKCGEVADPEIIAQRGGLDGDNTFLQLFGDVYVEVLDDVDHIEVSTGQPAFGYFGGHTQAYNVTGFTDENKYWLDDTELWKLPFVVNKTNTDYLFGVTYFCRNEDDPSEPIEGITKVVSYNPGDLCDDGGVWAGNEFFVADVLIDGNSSGGMQVKTDSFELKIKTRIPEGGSGVDLFIFPTTKIESTTVELITKTGKEYVKPIELEWSISNGGRESHLFSEIKLKNIFSEEDLKDAGSIGFRLKRCGGKEFYKTYPLVL